MREIGSGTRNSVERFLAERGVHLSVSMEMNTNTAIKQGVEEGLGLGIVSIHTLERELESGRLTVIDAECFPILRQWFIVHRAGKRLSAVATEFAEFVRHESGQFVRDDIIKAALGESLLGLAPLRAPSKRSSTPARPRLVSLNDEVINEAGAAKTGGHQDDQTPL